MNYIKSLIIISFAGFSFVAAAGDYSVCRKQITVSIDQIEIDPELESYNDWPTEFDREAGKKAQKLKPFSIKLKLDQEYHSSSPYTVVLSNGANGGLHTGYLCVYTNSNFSVMAMVKVSYNSFSLVWAPPKFSGYGSPYSIEVEMSHISNFSQDVNATYTQAAKMNIRVWGWLSGENRNRQGTWYVGAANVVATVK